MTYHNDLLKEVKRIVLDILKGYRPSLSQTTGALPVNQVPSNIPGTRLSPGSVTPTELSFDPATQAELDAHAADTSTHGVADMTALITEDDNARVAVRKNSAGSVYTRRRLNLIEGTGATITLADDSGGEEVDITIAASGGGGGSIDVTDGTTTVSPTSVLRLPAGTVTDNGSGEAEYTPAAGGGGMTLIQDIVISSTTATVTFSSIPGTYTQLRMYVVSRTDDTATFGTIYQQLNTDTGSNYDSQVTQSVGGTVASGAVSGATHLQVGDTAAANSPSGAFAGNVYDYPFYTDAVHKTVLGQSTQPRSDGTILAIQSVARWRNTAAITQIDLFASAGSFVAGSRFTLYGL